MAILRLSCALITMLALGWALTGLIFGRARSLAMVERLSLSYGIGVGAASLLMLACHILRLPFSLAAVFFLAAALFAAGAFRKKEREESIIVADAARDQRLGPLGLFLACGIAGEVAYLFFRALIRPIESYDAIAIYAIKAKIFFLSSGIPLDYFRGLVHLFPHPDYPLNIPLAESFIYLFLSGVNDQLVKIIFPLYTCALLAMLYCAIRRLHANKTYALLFVFLLATVPQFSAYGTNAYLELPLSFYVFSGFSLLCTWMQERKMAYLVGSAVMLALAAWTKNEGLLYCLICLALAGLFLIGRLRTMERKDLLSLCVYPLIIIGVLVPWMVVKRAAHIVNDEIDLANVNPFYLGSHLYKLKAVFYEFQKQFFGPKKWNIIWFAIAGAACFYWRKALATPHRHITLAIIFAVCGYMLFYLVSYVEVGYFASKTWARFLLHFLPITVYWLAVMLKDDLQDAVGNGGEKGAV